MRAVVVFCYLLLIFVVVFAGFLIRITSANGSPRSIALQKCIAGRIFTFKLFNRGSRFSTLRGGFFIFRIAYFAGSEVAFQPCDEEPSEVV